MLSTPGPALFTFREGSPSTAERQSDGALDALRTLIITLDLEPGSVVNEASLAPAIGCGRTPLREAIHRLAEEHLLIILPHRAVAVAPITIADLQQIYEARFLMEGAAARLAAQRATPQQLAWLTERNDLLASLSDSSDPEVFRRWSVRHFEFHHMLAKASGNDYLTDGLRRVLPAAMRLSYYLFKNRAMAMNRQRNHEAIIAALMARNADEAEEAIRRHITGAKERLLRIL